MTISSGNVPSFNDVNAFEAAHRDEIAKRIDEKIATAKQNHEDQLVHELEQEKDMLERDRAGSLDCLVTSTAVQEYAKTQGMDGNAVDKALAAFDKDHDGQFTEGELDGLMKQAINPTTVVVRPGESLADVAARLTGNPTNAWDLYWANTDKLPPCSGELFTDPAALKAGTELNLPTSYAFDHGNSPDAVAQAAATTPDGKALQATQALFQNGGAWKTDGRLIQQDLDDVNHSWTDPAKLEAAHAQLAQNQPLVDAKLSLLPPAAQQQYKAVAATLKGAPKASLALQALVLQGKLPGKDANLDGQTTLGALAKLADPHTPLAAGIDRKDLVGQLAQEVAFPTSIDQHGKDTCTVTAVEIKAAMVAPAEYIRLVGGLASPDGKVTLKNGDVLTRVAGTATDDGSDRSISGRLWQAAMMDYGDGAYTDYDNAKDAHVAQPGAGDHPNEDFVTKCLKGVFGETAHLVFKQDDFMAAIQKNLAAGKPVTCSLDWGTGGHGVLVTKVEGDRVTIANPWGEEDVFTLTAFKQRFQAANIS